MRVKLFCLGVVFSEAAALSSSSVQNMISVSIWLKLCKTNSEKNLSLARLGILNTTTCLKVQVLGIPDCFRFPECTTRVSGGGCVTRVCLEMTMDMCEGKERKPEGKGMKGSC